MIRQHRDHRKLLYSCIHFLLFCLHVSVHVGSVQQLPVVYSKHRFITIWENGGYCVGVGPRKCGNLICEGGVSAKPYHQLTSCIVSMQFHQYPNMGSWHVILTNCVGALSSDWKLGHSTPYTFLYYFQTYPHLVFLPESNQLCFPRLIRVRYLHWIFTLPLLRVHLLKE